MTRSQFEVLIIGTGFGGAIAAARLAKAGKKVLLLERGRSYDNPRPFPRTPHELSQSIWAPHEKLFGLLHFHFAKKLGTLGAAGVGGGSLIYSGVTERKNPSSFIPGVWPLTYTDLEPHYDRVEERIGAKPFSKISQRSRQFTEAGRILGLNPRAASLAIDESRCRNCGECIFGCNDNAKSSLDRNFITDAVTAGAELRTLAEARIIRPNLKGGYEVGYIDWSKTPSRGHEPPIEVIRADRVILSAGSVNSTYLLLKNKCYLKNLSPVLGQNFGGNGDLLAFALSARGDLSPTDGPTITTSLDGERFSIQDVGYPAFFAWMLQGLGVTTWAGRGIKSIMARSASAFFAKEHSNLGRVMSRILSPAERQLFILCSMGHEPATGRLYLDSREKLELDWDRKSSEGYYDELRTGLRKLASQWDAKYIDFMHFFPRRMTTVHPLGGCPMGETSATGLVDSWGRVFGHPKLYVSDGAILPSAVGINPSLTIAAMSDRVAQGILNE